MSGLDARAENIDQVQYWGNDRHLQVITCCIVNKLIKRTGQ